MKHRKIYRIFLFKYLLNPHGSDETDYNFDVYQEDENFLTHTVQMKPNKTGVNFFLDTPS